MAFPDDYLTGIAVSKCYHNTARLHKNNFPLLNTCTAFPTESQYMKYSYIKKKHYGPCSSLFFIDVGAL